MKASLRRAWESRSPRERTIIAVLAATLVVFLYVWLVLSAGQERVQLSASVTALRAQAERLERQALEYDRLQAAPAVTRSPTDLHTVLETSIHDAGLSHALLRLDVVDADQVVAVFGAVAFRNWLNWIANLKSQHVRLDTCRIEALSTPGMVSATATLTRAKPQ